MTYPYLPYAVTEAYCAIFAVTVWFRLNSSIGSEHEVRQLRNMIYSYFIMLVTDIVWALMEDGLIHMPRLLNAAFNAATVSAVACGCYFWFRFIEDRLHFPFAANKTANMLLTVPLLVIFALDVCSIFTGWLFYIDEQGHYQATDWFTIHTVINYFYLLIPTIFSVRRAVQTRSHQERGEYRTYALYMIAPLISGFLEDSLPTVPLLALNIFMMILILFLMIQNMQIYHDALTGLNNRRRLNRYLEECLPKVSPERPLLLFIMDINSFKAVNDDYGHLEGDRALQIFSAVLKDAATRYFAFAARYGGDEFCLVMDAAGHVPGAIAAELQKNLEIAQLPKPGAHSAYTFTVSIGHALCENPEENPETVLSRADRLLYDNKKEWHRHEA